MATKKPAKKGDVKSQTSKVAEPELIVKTDDNKSVEPEVKEENILDGTPFKSVDELKQSWLSSRDEGTKTGEALNQIKERAKTDPELNSKLADVFGIPKLEPPQKEESKEEPSTSEDPWIEKKKAEEVKKEQLEVDSFVQEHKETFFTDGGTFNQEEWRKVSSLYPVVLQTAEMNNEILSTKEALDRALYFSKNPNPNKEIEVNPQEREAEHATQSTGATGSKPPKEVKLTADQQWVVSKFPSLTKEGYIEELEKQK